MRRLSSLSSTTRIFFTAIPFPLVSAQYAVAPAESQTNDVDLPKTFRLGPRDARPDALRAEPDGGAAPRQRADRALQLPVRASSRRALHPPHRGHGSRTVDRRVHGGDRRRAPLARARLGRGPVPADGPARALSRARREAPRRRCRLPLLVHAGGARGASEGGARRRAASRLRSHVPRSPDGPTGTDGVRAPLPDTARGRAR